MPESVARDGKLFLTSGAENAKFGCGFKLLSLDAWVPGFRPERRWGAGSLVFTDPMPFMPL